MNTVEQRLRMLERDYQRSRRINQSLVVAVVAIGCIATAQVATPQTSKPQTAEQTSSPKVPSIATDGQVETTPSTSGRIRTIETEELVLRDPSGRERLRMAITDDGPAISMFDASGKKRLVLGLSSITSGLQLLDSQESSIVSLQLPEDAGAARLEMRSPQGTSMTKADGFSVLDAGGQSRLQLALLNGDFPVLGISQHGQRGPASIEMVAGKGSRSLKIHDDAGHPLFSVSTSDRNTTSIALRHPEHDRSLEISTGSKDADGPVMALFAPASNEGNGGLLPLLKLGLGKDHQPYLRILDRDGRTRFDAPSE